MMDPVTVRTGTKRFDGEAHGIAFSVYVRENGEVKLWVKRRMRLKGGPQNRPEQRTPLGAWEACSFRSTIATGSRPVRACRVARSSLRRDQVSSC